MLQRWCARGVPLAWFFSKLSFGVIAKRELPGAMMLGMRRLLSVVVAGKLPLLSGRWVCWSVQRFAQGLEIFSLYARLSHVLAYEV